VTKAFLLNAAFAMATRDLTSCAHLASFVCYHATQIDEIFHNLPSVTIRTGDGCLEILITLAFSTLISIQY
jgi:hypothetical protein